MIFGKLEVHLRSATLTRDVQKLGTMNPYVVLKVGDVKKTSAANSGGGKNPKWCDQIEFHKTKELQLFVQVFNQRKLGLFDNDLIGTCVVELSRFQQAYSAEEDFPLNYDGDSVGTVRARIIFTPDVEVGVIQGQLVQTGESTLDLTLRVISASMTRDTQWFGQMSSYYVLSCGDRKFTSTVCNNGGKKPQWADKFSLVKRADQTLNIDIQNQNNKTSIAYCTVTHSQLMDGFRPGIRTIPLMFEGQQAGIILLDVTFNSLPGNNSNIALPPPVLAPAAQTISVNVFTQQQPTGVPGIQPIMQPNFPPQAPPPAQQYSQNYCEQESQGIPQQQQQQQSNSYGVYPSLPTEIKVQQNYQQDNNQNFNNQAPQMPQFCLQNAFSNQGCVPPQSQQSPYGQQPQQPQQQGINLQIQFQPKGNPQFPPQQPQQPGQNGFFQPPRFG